MRHKITLSWYTPPKVVPNSGIWSTCGQNITMARAFKYES